MTDFNAKTATPDTTITDDNSILIGADSQSSTTPSVYSFGTIKTWIKSWIAKADVGLGNVTNNLQLTAANNLSDLADAGAARNNLNQGMLLDADFSDSQVYLSTLASTATSGVAVANRLSMIPIYVPRTRIYTTYAIVVATLSASTSVRLALYDSVASSGYLQPNAKLDEATSTIDTSTGTGVTGLKTVAFSVNQTLKPGWYFLASLSDGAPTVQRVAGFGAGVRLSGSGATYNGGKYRDGVTYAALPSNESAQTYTSMASAGTALPLVGIR